MRLHEQVQKRILDACNSMGLQAQSEYIGKDWRADVFTSANKLQYAFEVQITPQSLKKTQERQAKYIRDGIVGCWLFEKEPARQEVEMEDLPIFKLDAVDDNIFVSLKERKTLPLDIFIHDFLHGKIKFCHTLNPLPKVEILFIEMGCWKCGLVNHIYYIAPFQSPCNTRIQFEEAMWTSDKLAFHPEIINQVKEYVKSEKGQHLNLAVVKERYSNTTKTSYASFGCSECDSIFGDWYIQEAIMETWYGGGIIDRFSFDINFDLDMRQEIPHWCHPDEHDFCE